MSKLAVGVLAAPGGSGSMTTTTGGGTSATSALRRIGDDPVLRPFLNSLFDPQAYVRTIIKDGKSEDCLVAINDCTEKINDEIQRFISKNKDSLMSGMQDISSLAQRYHSLADHSKGLQTIVQRMKRETADSYNLIKARTSELDRIHDASTLLNHVKRFVKAKAQLDQYLKNQDDKDLRSLASAAKVVAELEKLLSIPNIQGIQLVQENVSTIKSFGNNIRILAQTKLLEATAEKNQAAMAHYLQVFYNLETLPEILLLTIDQTVRMTADSSKDALQLDMLATIYHDYVHKQGSSSSTTATTTGLLPSNSAAKRSISTTAIAGGAAATGGNSASTQHQPVTLSQLRIAMREITHAWSTIIFERATQMLILQRVVHKKEDPITHVKFRDVLREKSGKTVVTGGAEDSSVSYLGQGQIVALFWQRLSIALHDICSEKLRHHPAEVVCRMYPYLRRAAQDVLNQMQSWSDDKHHLVTGAGSTSSTSSSSLTFLQDGDWTIEQLLSMEMPTSPFQQDWAVCESMWASDSQVVGMFGSSVWHEDITRFRGNTNGNSSSEATKLSMMKTVNGGKGSLLAEGGSISGSATSLITSLSREADLVQGLQPIRDRFLLAVLDRMQHPIGQMFPDLDGYVAAIPSKRDLMTLLRAIQQEYITVATESTDVSFIQLLNREFVKTVRLMLTKMESMIITSGQELRRVATSSSASGGVSSNTAAGNTSSNNLAANASQSSTSNSNNSTAVPNFVRTAPQEHNAQCFILLGQLREALQKLPSQVIQHLDDTNNSSSATATTGEAHKDGKTPMKTPSVVPESARKSLDNVGGGTSSVSNSGANAVFVDNVLREMTRATEQACADIDDLAMRQIVEPMLTLLTEYTASILGQLHRESVITTPNQQKSTTSSNGKAPTDNSATLTIEHSLAVQALLRQLPALLKTFLFSLPKIPGSSLLDRAGEEFAGRVLMLYMSLASLSRPLTEAVRLRTAKDLSALEMMISQQFPHVSSSNKTCPIMREFRAFRRLLFEEQLFANTNVVSKNKAAAVASVPNRSRLLALDYFQDLRPSTVLALLMAAGPAQLPLPPDLPTPQGREVILHVLALVQAIALSNNNSGNSSRSGHALLNNVTVRNLYVPTPAMTSQLHHQLSILQQQQSIASQDSTSSGNGSNASGSSSASEVAALVATVWTWKKIPAEKAAWELIQQCLDVYFQRLTVAEVPEQKQEMRAWYEAIMDIGSHYFS